MFYRLFPDGSVCDHSADKYADDCLETDEQIVRAWDGAYYLASNCPPVPDDVRRANELAAAKAVRAEAVSQIIVEVDGMQFDANEAAQSRMARSLAGAMALGLDLDATTTQWVLADNSIATVSARQLAQALQLAGAAQTELWVVPYEDN